MRTPFFIFQFSPCFSSLPSYPEGEEAISKASKAEHLIFYYSEGACHST